MNNKVVTLKFLALCGLTFLALCNVAVFYDFHDYLLTLGFETKRAGLLVGLYSLSAMFLYATMSQRITVDNARRVMLSGIAMVAGCAISYPFVFEFWQLALVRIVNGAGGFLLMASCMVVLVSIIPAARSGHAFSMYSVALLAPYSIMPAVVELVQPWIHSPVMRYMATGCLLLPATCLLFYIRLEKAEKSIKSAPEKDRKGEGSEHQARKASLFRKPVLAILLVNCIYFMLFAAIFYLFKGFALERGVAHPGYFFTIQMGVMVAIRLFGGKIFDTFSKVLLVGAALLVTGAGFLLLYIMPSPAWLFPIAVVFGLGMGLCIPPLNSLMYLVTTPEFRGYNANMMMLSLHLGNFAGPVVGTFIIDIGGYNLFLLVATLLTVCGTLFFIAVKPERGARV